MPVEDGDDDQLDAQARDVDLSLRSA